MYAMTHICSVHVRSELSHHVEMYSVCAVEQYQSLSMVFRKLTDINCFPLDTILSNICVGNHRATAREYLTLHWPRISTTLCVWLNIHIYDAVLALHMHMVADVVKYSGVWQGGVWQNIMVRARVD